MAIIPESQYPGQTTPSSPTYPLGSAKDVAAPGSGDGTPLQEAWMNDIWGFLQAVLNAGKITASGLADTALTSQYKQALNNIAAASNPNRRITIANSLTTPNTRYVCNPGIIWDSTNQLPIVLTAALEKDITSPWLPGDTNGAYPSTGAPLTPGNWYHVFELRKDDGIVDSGIDISVSAVNLSVDALAAGYTTLERIGSIYYTSGSIIDPFFQKGNLFVPGTPTQFTPTLTTAYSTHSLAVPDGVNVAVQLYGSLSNTSGSSGLIFKSTFLTEGGEMCRANSDTGVGTIADLITNTVRQIDAKYTGATADLFIIGVLSYREFF